MTLAARPLATPEVGSNRPLRLAVLDMSGTTVDEGGLQDEAFTTAVTEQGVAPGSSRFQAMLGWFHERRGISRHETFRTVFPEDHAAAVRANQRFEKEYDRLLEDRGVRPVPGAAEAVERLREAGLQICLTTGFARHTQNMILESLGWMSLADLSLCPSDAGRGAPYPDMVLTALLALDLDDVRSVMVVGDTVSDIRSGQRAGAGLTVGVLTGHHDQASLEEAEAAVVVPSIQDVPDLVRPQH